MAPVNGQKLLPPHLRPQPSTPTGSDHGVPVPQQSTAPPQDSVVSPVNGKKLLPPHLRPRPSTHTDSDRCVPVPQKCTASFQDSIVSPVSPPETKASGDDVREKLSNLGVKISCPKPASANFVDGADWGAQEPRQPSVAPRCSGRGRGGRGAANAPRQSNHAESAANTNREPCRAPSPSYRGRGRGGRQAPRASRWPTSKELAAPKPGKHDTGPMSVSGWSIESAQADFGIGGNNKKHASADAIDFKLTDRNGEWAPAPLNWDARPAFSDPTKAASIERWLREMMCDVRPFSADRLSSTDELAPRYWVPSPVRNQAPTAFFQELMAVDKPAPVDADDLVGVKPWWELYQSSSAPTLQPYSHPFLAGVDKDETLEERLARENDYGADKHVENKKRTEMAKKAAKREQQSKTKKLPKAKSDNIAAGAFVGNRITPGLNLYVRSARPDDMVQVRDIYNYHVDFTCCAPETQRLTTCDTQARFDGVVDSGLPFLVACERGGKVTARRGRKKYDEEEDLVLPDRVVGFTMAHDFVDKLGMYRFACEIEVFVKQEYYMKGIAKCLLDKVMALLDPMYVERGGFDIPGQELEGMSLPRIIQSVLARVPYEKPERLEWTGRWLHSMEFGQVADMPEIGQKDGKSVSLAIFLRKTGATTDAAGPGL